MPAYFTQCLCTQKPTFLILVHGCPVQQTPLSNLPPRLDSNRLAKVPGPLVREYLARYLWPELNERRAGAFLFEVQDKAGDKVVVAPTLEAATELEKLTYERVDPKVSAHALTS